jgi:hypothetical protein
LDVIHPMISLDEAFERLARSSFRRKFRLMGRELAYLQTWGLDHVMKQAGEILDRRVAMATPLNDGRQTPWRNHPVFVAQHATGTCCRGCIEKVHSISRGAHLSQEERSQLLSAIARWLQNQIATGG